MLDLYPRRWREQHGPAMLGTLLDVAEAEGRDRPTAAERIDLAAHAILARLDTTMPTPVRNGVAAVALATGTAFALSYLIFAGWAPFLENRELLHPERSFGPFMNSGVILCAAWVLAFSFAMLGWKRATKIARAASVAIAIILFVGNQVLQTWDGPISRNLGFSVILAVFAILGTPSSRPRLALGTAVWLAVFVGGYATRGLLTSDGDRYFWYLVATPENIAWGLAATPIVVLVLLALRRPLAAAIVLWSLLPWLAACFAGLAAAYSDIAMAALVAGAVATALVIGARFALRRAGISIQVTVARAESPDTLPTQDVARRNEAP